LRLVDFLTAAVSPAVTAGLLRPRGLGAASGAGVAGVVGAVYLAGCRATKEPREIKERSGHIFKQGNPGNVNGECRLFGFSEMDRSGEDYGSHGMHQQGKRKVIL
jgi:hypothetical protein